MFKIGDFSRFSRVSVKMLRHYDELGLLVPRYVDPHTGYRYYTADQLPRLNRILALRDLGFSLEQIGGMVDDELSLAELRGMLKLRRAERARRLEEEQARLERVAFRLEQIEREATGPQHDVIVRAVEGQLVAALRRELPPDGESITDLFERLERYVAGFGARTVDQLEENLGVLDFELTVEQVDRLSALAGFNLDFPLSFLTSDNVRNLVFGDSWQRLEGPAATTSRWYPVRP